MENARIVLIVGMLMAVLLSAFAAERLRVCHGERRCLVESMPGLLPAARFFMVRAANRAGTAETQTQIQTEPRPADATAPSADPVLVLPAPDPHRRRDAEARPRPSP